MQTILTSAQLALLVNSLRLNAERLWNQSEAHSGWAQKSAELARSEAKELEKLALYFETTKGN